MIKELSKSVLRRLPGYLDYLKAMPEDMTADAITDPALVVEMKQPVVPNEW